jgi:hypothetical protein
MKLTIFYESQVITTIIKENIPIKDLLSALGKSLKEDFKHARILNEEQKVVEFNTKIEAKKEEGRLYIIKPLILKKKHNNQVDTPLDELIPEITGGKTKLKKAPKQRTNDPGDRLAMIEQMMNTNLSNLVIPGVNVNNRMAEITMIQDMLRNIMGGQNIQINTGNQVNSSNNITPNETHVTSLKEMGFPEDRSRRALIMARNNLSRATDLLLNDALDYEQPQRYNMS